MRKSTRTLIALTAAVSFTAAACSSDETPVDDTVVDTEEVVDTVDAGTDEVIDTVVDDVTEEVVTTDE